jgi:hypothetical protein
MTDIPSFLLKTEFLVIAAKAAIQSFLKLVSRPINSLILGMKVRSQFRHSGSASEPESMSF